MKRGHKTRRGGIRIPYDDSRYEWDFEGAIYRNVAPTDSREETAINSNPNCSWKEGDIAKVFDPKLKDAFDREQYAARKVHTLRNTGIPLTTILTTRWESDPTKVCTVPGRKRQKSVLFSEYGGTTLKDIAGDLDSMRGKLKAGVKMEVNLDAATKADILAALRELRKDIVILNEAGLIHGDVHEGNIVYNEKTKVAKLIDFGAAGFANPGTKEWIQNATDLRYLDEMIQTIHDPASFLPKKGGRRRARTVRRRRFA